MNKKRNQSAFTIIELMVTIAILGILLTVAVPSFTDFINNQKVKTFSLDLFYSIMLARSEAIKRNTTVYVNPNGGTAAGWADGWSVSTVNKTYAECVSDATNCLKIIPAVSSAYIVNAAPTTVQYNKKGRTTVGTGTGTFELCDNANKATKRIVAISSSGAPSINQGGSCP